ncbi:hypothetical protein PM082_015361 [Marasmius tenuissimus]|nr:hypothetical protein PM082_015361 [Marasmius tenuissimus]
MLIRICIGFWVFIYRRDCVSEGSRVRSAGKVQKRPRSWGEFLFAPSPTIQLETTGPFRVESPHAITSYSSQ